MDSTLATSTTFLPFHNSNSNNLIPKTPSFLPSKTHQKPTSKITFSANFSTNHNIYPTNEQSNEYPFAKTIQKVSKVAIFTLAATLMATKLGDLPVKAEPLTPIVEETIIEDEKIDEIDEVVEEKSPLSKMMEKNVEFVENLRSILHKKLEDGEDEAALEVLSKLVEAQPKEIEWKFLMARLLNEMGKVQESREVFEEILSVDPLCFEALFENALLMDRCGEGEGVIARLERALGIAMDEGKAKEARDVRLIMAQILFLQKNVEEALRCYEELRQEDPKDFRPYFCKGMIYSLLDRNDEAREQFAKYKELSPEKFEVEGYLRSPISRMKLFETGSRS